MESEVIQAAELLEQWRKRSPIEVSDALKLLGKNVAFQTGLVSDLSTASVKYYQYLQLSLIVPFKRFVPTPLIL